MKALRYVPLVAVLALALLGGTGCGKKSSETSPIDDGKKTADTGGAKTVAQQISAGIVYFDYDKFDIKSEYRDMMTQKANLIKGNQQIRVQIEGHCDERGTEEYNLALGERRARAAYQYLIKSGVKPAQLSILSLGKKRPAVQGENEAAWSKNRRAEFKVTAGQ